VVLDDDPRGGGKRKKKISRGMRLYPNFFHFFRTLAKKERKGGKERHRESLGGSNAIPCVMSERHAPQERGEVRITAGNGVQPLLKYSIALPACREMGEKEKGKERAALGWLRLFQFSPFLSL